MLCAAQCNAEHENPGTRICASLTWPWLHSATRAMYPSRGPALVLTSAEVGLTSAAGVLTSAVGG